jgi:7-cyano-7-deazaguanine synthase in queuosine biosynthesis
MTDGILLSGGMDSTVLAWDLVKQQGKTDLLAFVVSHSCGTLDETVAAQRVAAQLGIRCVQGSLFPTVACGDIIPARNMLLVAWAANILHTEGGGTLYLGFCAEDRRGFHDCDEPFLRAVNDLLSVSNVRVKVAAPYMHLSKQEIAALPGGEYAQQASYSCYLPDGPCGTCTACKLRAASLT